MQTELLIMAAGMGSRFGGLKQIEPVGPNGESILDFSIYDAKRAGFDKAIIVIKKEIEKTFRELVGKRIEKIIDVDYAFQELDKLPQGYELPKDRQKPWGTGHAVLCARDKISAPFAVINADDFYGPGSYQVLHDYLVSHDGMCMVGYKLENTLTENGTVSRGVCQVENGLLSSVVEHTALDKSSSVAMDTIVSMNMWGLDTAVFDYFEKAFTRFLEERITEPKSEFYLPSGISERMAEEGKTVAVLTTDEQWYGVTYREDLNLVRNAMCSFVEKGLYKFL